MLKHKKTFKWYKTGGPGFDQKNNSFDPKRHETHFLSWSTWFEPYWPGELGFGQKWRFWPETARNSFFILVDMVWPVLTRW